MTLDEAAVIADGLIRGWAAAADVRADGANDAYPEYPGWRFWALTPGYVRPPAGTLAPWAWVALGDEEVAGVATEAGVRDLLRPRFAAALRELWGRAVQASPAGRGSCR